MSRRLRILMVEDSPDDAELIIDGLHRAGYDPEWTRVEREREFRDSLDPNLDLILADFGLPQFSGLRALQILRELSVDVPLVLISGSIGEEVAVKALQEGAADYLLKDRLARLGPAIERALEQRRLRTEQRAAITALRDEKDLLIRLMENLPDLIYFKDTDSRFVRTNAAAAASYGVDSPEDLVGRTDSEFMPAEIARVFVEDDLKVMETRLPVIDRVERIVGVHGEIRWLSTTKAPTFDATGSISGIVGIGRDITDRVRANEARLASEARYRNLFEEAPVMYVITERRQDEPYIVDCNELFLVTLGFSRDEIIGQPLVFLLHGDAHLDLLSTYQRTLEGEVTEVEQQLITRQGDRVECLIQTRRELNADGSVRGARSAVINITRRKVLERALIHQAWHDALTGLPNRMHFTRKLEMALAANESNEPGSIAVVFLDLDDFKTVNDSLGHATGDQLLIAVARRLESKMQPGTMLARFGGDEFTVLLPTTESAKDAELIAEQLVHSLRAPFQISGREFRMGASVGVVYNGPSVNSALELLQGADVALYRAKAEGRSGFRVFAQSMADEILDKLDLQTELAGAIERDELRLHYQPEVSLETGEILGAEALIRWQHPTRGLLYPAAFIQLAEESDLIVPIGMWALGAACLQLDEWRASQPTAARLEMGVNVSARQLRRPRFLEDVSRLIGKTGIPPQQLKLEITERVVLKDAEADFSVLQALRKLNIKLAIDDFGTGYSSLGYLRQWPADALKIDRSFLLGIEEDADSRELVQAFIGLGRALRMDVTAEGIETPGQVRWLRQASVKRGQGYHFAPPVPADEFARLLAGGPGQAPYRGHVTGSMTAHQARKFATAAS